MGFTTAKRDTGAETVARLRELIGGSVIGAEGVLADLFPDLDEAEYAALNRSASLLKERADAIPL